MMYPNEARRNATDTINTSGGSMNDSPSQSVAEQARSALAQADVRQMVSQYPWIALGTAIGLGYTIGSMSGDKLNIAGIRDTLSERMSGSRHAETTEFAQRYTDVLAADAPTKDALQQATFYPQQAEAKPGLASRLIPDEIKEELSILSQAGIEVARQWLRDTVRENIPAARQQIDDLDRRSPITNAKQAPEDGYSPLS